MNETSILPDFIIRPRTARRWSESADQTEIAKEKPRQNERRPVRLPKAWRPPNKTNYYNSYYRRDLGYQAGYF